MTAKRKKPTQKQLSERAKKGWVTRRRHIHARAVANDIQSIARRKRTPAVEKQVAALEKQLADIAKRDKQAMREDMKLMREDKKRRARAAAYAGMSYDEGLKAGAHMYDWMKLDFTAAKFPSRLRRLGDTEKLRKKLDRIVDKYGLDTMQFQRIADDFSVDIREVFSLHFSP